jgi:3-dehydrosphinganine reductase
MDVNYFGTFYPTRYVLPKMKAAGDGIIVITASQGALMGIYGYGAYAASKFALRGLAETIAMESKSKGVSVTLALPTDTDTPGEITIFFTLFLCYTVFFYRPGK